jgi:hypothetical protein
VLPTVGNRPISVRAVACIVLVSAASFPITWYLVKSWEPSAQVTPTKKRAESLPIYRKGRT